MGQQLLMTMIPAIFSNLGAALSLTTKAAEIAGKVGRIAEIQEILDAFDDAAQTQPPLEQPTQSDNDCLALHDADIVTPHGEAIATDLSFRVVPGQSLMIVGRGGSGKTSCVRALRGLWTLPKGRRIVPGGGAGGGCGATRLKDLVVIPQQVHMAMGTLADQLTFPVFIEPPSRTVEMEARLLSLLKMVGIDYRVERWGGDADDVSYGEEHKGWDHEVLWADVLSLGEQQRMMVARMFFHRPRFAVLDECTSAVSVDAEETLYRLAQEQGTTLVTVSQTMTLPEFRSAELRIGVDNACGWSLHAVEKGQRNAVASGDASAAMHAARAPG